MLVGSEKLGRGAARLPMQALIVILLAAPLVIGMLWTWQVWSEKHSAALERSRQGAALVSEYVSRVLQIQIMLLDQVDRLAQENRDLEPRLLHEKLQALDAGFQYTTSLGLIDANGDAIAGSRSYPLQANFSHRDYFIALRNGGEDLVIDRIKLRPIQRDTVTIARRLSGDGFGGVVTASTEISKFTDFLSNMTFDADSVAVVVRADGKVLARPDPNEQPLMMLPDGEGMRAMARSAAGYFDAPGRMDGIERTYAFVRVPDLPIFAVHGFSKRMIWRDTLRAMIGNILILIVCSFLAIVALVSLFRRIELERIRVAAEHDRRLLDEARRTNAIREAMLKEVNHRIHNNLQTIQSLIRMQSRQPIDPKVMLQEISKRVWAISEIHGLLYRSAEYSSLELSAFVRALAANPSIVPPERGIAVRCDLDTVTIDIRQAVPVALVVLEAVTNAVKHAFPGGRAGEITITLRRDGEQAEISVHDNGVGLPDDEQRASGTRLAAVLTEQIEGRLTWRNAPQGGVDMRLRFPLAAPGMAAMTEQEAEPA